MNIEKRLMQIEEWVMHIFATDAPITRGNTEILLEKTKEITLAIQQISTQIKTEHLTIMGGIGVLLIVGIAILINQRKIKKQLKKLLEEKDKP